MKKGIAAALLILTISATTFAGDTIVPQKHGTCTTTSWTQMISSMWNNLFY